MFLFGSVVLCIATLMNIKTKVPFISVIPATKYVEAVVNGICAVLCLILVFKPEARWLQYTVYIVEAALTTLIGFVGIGTLLFSALIITLFINGFFATKRKRKITLLAVYWCAVAAGLYPAFGIRPLLFEVALTFFYLAFFTSVYEKLESKLSYLLPSIDVTTGGIQLPPHGATLTLSDYGLSERQVNFVKLCIENGLTYEQLSEKYHISTSVVKKDMASACKLFGVKNREALRVLLLQYKIK